MANKINLDKAKAFYLNNNITLKDLSKFFIINYETLRKRATAEKWQEEKQALKSSSILVDTKTDGEPIKENISIEDLKNLRLENTYKLLKLLDKSYNSLSPNEINKIKLVAGALNDIHKIINDLELKEDTNKDTLNKLDFVLEQIKGNI